MKTQPTRRSLALALLAGSVFLQGCPYLMGIDSREEQAVGGSPDGSPPPPPGVDSSTHDASLGQAERDAEVGAADADTRDAGDAASDARGPLPDASVEAGPDAAPAPRCPGDRAITTTELNLWYGWKSGAPSKGSCSAADLALLRANRADPGWLVIADLGKGVSAPCRACAITPETSSVWGPFVVRPSRPAPSGLYNFGACYGAIDGPACGKAVQYTQLCLTNDCADCAAADLDACTSKSLGPGGTCRAFYEDIAATCPNYAAARPYCANIFDAAATLCGG